MSYFLAPALEQFRDEVNALFPRRDKASDGWIGDPSHAARVSDHNPDWNDTGRTYGIVRAIDIDIDDNDPNRDLRRMILNAAIGDPRVWYVISNGIIYSATYGFKARRYTGSNLHFAHVHISLRHNVREFDKSRWFEPQKRRVRLVPVDASNVKRQFLIAAEVERGEVRFNNGVGRVQRSLNARYGTKLAVDGLVGEATLNAWGKHERRTDGSGRPRVPDEKSLAALARGRFRVVA